MTRWSETYVPTLREDPADAEALVTTIGRIRRGMTAIVITPSLDRDWIKALATLRSRGVASVVILLDVPAFERHERDERGRGADKASVADASALAEESASAQQLRALRHALAEYDIPVFLVGPTTPLAAVLAT